MFEIIVSVIVGLVFLKIVKPKAHTNLMNSAETAIDAVSETAECASISLHLANNGLKKSLVELNQSLDFDNQEWLKLKENLYQTKKVSKK